MERADRQFEVLHASVRSWERSLARATQATILLTPESSERRIRWDATWNGGRAYGWFLLGDVEDCGVCTRVRAIIHDVLARRGVA